MTIQDKVEQDFALWANTKRLELLVNYESPGSGIMYFQKIYKTLAKVVFNYQVGSSQFIVTLTASKTVKEINIQNEDDEGWSAFWTFVHRYIK